MEEGTGPEELGRRMEELKNFKETMTEEMAKLKEVMVMYAAAPPAPPVRHHSQIDANEGWQTVDSRRRKNPSHQEESCQIDAGKDGNAAFHARVREITVADAAARILPDHLRSSLAKLPPASGNERTHLRRFAEYFRLAFSGVAATQFPWVKLFRDSSLPQIIEIPLSNVPYAVRKISIDWITGYSVPTLSLFTVELLTNILASIRGSVAQQSSSSKSQVAEFVVLAMVLRGKPEAILYMLPTALKDDIEYRVQDKLQVIAWMIAQACQGDLSIGLYAWASHLLPMFRKSTNNPQLNDLILQLAESILSAPTAHSILMDNAVRSYLISSYSFEILMKLTHPVSAVKTKTTERFKALYPTLKEIALAAIPGSERMEEFSQQIFSIAIQAAGEGTTDLAKEGTQILIWSLCQHSGCFMLWDELYLENLEASVAVLRNMSKQWEDLALSEVSQMYLRKTLKSFQKKNEKTLRDKDTPKQKQALFKDADTYCKELAKRAGHFFFDQKSWT